MKWKILAIAGLALGVAVMAGVKWAYSMFTSPPP
jgi:hypothetical protein